MNSVTPADSRGPLLDVRNLCVSFYDGEVWRETLKDVSFAVEPGEVVGIVGESGCGKSLTALSILGLLPRHGAGAPARCTSKAAILQNSPSARCATCAAAASAWCFRSR